jgi:hypothetical protein
MVCPPTEYDIIEVYMISYIYDIIHDIIHEIIFHHDIWCAEQMISWWYCGGVKHIMMISVLISWHFNLWYHIWYSSMILCLGPPYHMKCTMMISYQLSYDMVCPRTASDSEYDIIEVYMISFMISYMIWYFIFKYHVILRNAHTDFAYDIIAVFSSLTMISES